LNQTRRPNRNIKDVSTFRLQTRNLIFAFSCYNFYLSICTTLRTDEQALKFYIIVIQLQLIMFLLLILRDPSNKFRKILDMRTNPTKARKCMKIYYRYCVPPTCFGHSCDHLQGGSLQGIETSKYYARIRTNSQI
jgi:hypothetical protein